jgi:type III pantothenate kinase
MNTLCIDVGNTSITSGLYSGDRITRNWHTPTAEYHTFRRPPGIYKIVYASVVPDVDAHFKRLFSKYRFTALSYHSLPITIALKEKQAIGIDRLVNAVGAIRFYQTPAIIIDLGTATTFCVIDSNNTYQGGLICPGINLTRTVLHEKTAKLPLIEIKQPKQLIGKNTIEAMQSGIYYGYQDMLAGLIKRLKGEYPESLVIATGGYADLLCKSMPEVDVVDPDLTIKSLYYIGTILAISW